jgi:hypothetical protein
MSIPRFFSSSLGACAGRLDDTRNQVRAPHVVVASVVEVCPGCRWIGVEFDEVVPLGP